MITQDTIIACATPPGKSALAVIRISGPLSHELTKNLVREKLKYSSLQSNLIALFQIIDPVSNTETIDEVTIIKYSGPYSYTGEDMVECFCHGNPILINRIIDSYLFIGSRLSQPGEFTRRAFANGKLSFLKAESINQLINCETLLQQKITIQHYLGEKSSPVNHIKNMVIQIIQDLELVIEFNEGHDFDENIMRMSMRDKINTIYTIVDSELKKWETIKLLEKGMVIPIIGPPNAGKSSLLNLLVGYDRSIVHHEKGTTRDFISEKIEINSIPITIIDTAGLTTTNNTVEMIGIEKTYSLIQNNHLCIWVTSADESLTTQEFSLLKDYYSRLICIINKVDICSPQAKIDVCSEYNIDFLCLSANNELNRKPLCNFIVEQIIKKIGSVDFSCIVYNKRQDILLKKIKHGLCNLQDNSNLHEEILSVLLHEILKLFEEYEGKISSQDLLNNLFENFCIGK